MGQGVVHGVGAHRVQLRVPYAVLRGEQEGDELPGNKCGEMSPRLAPQHQLVQEGGQSRRGTQQTSSRKK